MTLKELEALQSALSRNRPKGDRNYGPCPRQVEGYDKACRAIAHALATSQPKFDADSFLKEAGVAR